MAENNKIEVKIEKELCILSEKNGYSKELNMVSWNGQPAKYDIRTWSEGHEKSYKGLTFTKEEAKRLYETLKKEFE